MANFFLPLFLIQTLCLGQSLSSRSSGKSVLPQYSTEVPCPCDLTLDKCDSPECCCDKDCKSFVRKNTTCFQGPWGGLHEVRALPGHNCSQLYQSTIQALLLPSSASRNPFEAIFEIYLCLSFEFSPYLGHFFQEKNILHSKDSYDQEVSDNDKGLSMRDPWKNVSSYSKEGGKSASGEGHHLHYGGIITTVIDFAQSIFGEVKLPMRHTSSSSCIPTALKYLVPHSSTCTHDISTKSVCSEAKGGPLDLKSYLTLESERVVKNRSSSEAVRAKVRLFSTNSAEKYLSFKGAHRASPKWQVDNDVELLSRFSNTSKDEWSFQPILEGQNLTLLPKSTLNVDLLGQVCQNIVLEVSYVFFWSGKEILGVEVNVVLGNFTLGEGRSVTQHFRAEYVHSSGEEVGPKSGEPGYNRGSPLLAGNFAQLDDIEDFVLDSFSYWQPSATSMCRDSVMKPVEFGVDLRAECLIQLSMDNFTDCSQLSRTIESFRDLAISAQQMLKGGNPYLNITSEDLLDIIYDEVELYEEEELLWFTTEPPTNVSLNSTAQNTTDAPPGPEKPLYAGVRFCKVANIVQIRILYTKSSAHTQQPIYRVSGVRVSPVTSEWAWRCVGKSSKHCADIQSYPMIMSVKFDEVPLRWHHENTSRFWIRQEALSCHGERCWSEIAYPLTHWAHESGDLRAYVTSWGIILSIAAATCLFCTRSEW